MSPYSINILFRFFFFYFAADMYKKPNLIEESNKFQAEICSSEVGEGTLKMNGVVR